MLKDAVCSISPQSASEYVPVRIAHTQKRYYYVHEICIYKFW